MLNLMLLRHAKSSLAEAGQEDSDRSLNDRGRLAATAMGRYMASHSLVPQLVLCSPARRARETWGLVAGELKTVPGNSHCAGNLRFRRWQGAHGLPAPQGRGRAIRVACWP